MIIMVAGQGVKSSSCTTFVPMNDDPFVNSKKAFYVDGSFRDIYVFETDESVFGDVPFDAFTPLHRPLQDKHTLL